MFLHLTKLLLQMGLPVALIICLLSGSLMSGTVEVNQLSGINNHPNDPDFASPATFKCMVNLISRGINDRASLLTGQNIYIP